MKDNSVNWSFVMKVVGAVMFIMISVVGFLLSSAVEEKCETLDNHGDRISTLEKTSAVRTSEVLHMKGQVVEIKAQNKVMLEGLHRLEVRFGTLPDSLRK